MKKSLKSILFVFSCLCFMQVGLTQMSIEDIKRAINAGPNNEEHRLELLAKLCKLSFEQDPVQLDSLSVVFKRAAQKRGDSIWVYKAYQIEGLARLINGDLGSAVGAHQFALKWFPSSEPLESKIKIINNIAGFYSELGNYDKALLFNQRALEQVTSAISNHYIGKLYVSRAIVYDLIDQHDSAVYYANKAVDLALEKNDTALLVRAEAELQDVMLDTGNVAEAVSDTEQKLSMLRKVSRPYTLLSGLQRLGDGYTLLGDYGKAIAYYREANTLALESGYTERISSTYQSLANVYIRMGAFQKAEVALNHYGEYLSQLHGQMMPDKMELYELQLQLESKRHRNELLEQQSLLDSRLKENQRWVITIGTVLLVISLLLLGVSLYFRRKLKLNYNRLEQALEEVNKQKQLLETRVHERTEELELRNKQLQVHSYELSHKLRASVARIQAATSLFIEETDDEDRKKLVEAIEFSAHEADNVIRDIINEFNNSRVAKQ